MSVPVSLVKSLESSTRAFAGSQAAQQSVSCAAEAFDAAAPETSAAVASPKIVLGNLIMHFPSQFEHAAGTACDARDRARRPALRGAIRPPRCLAFCLVE